ncbi:hypothetical protein TVAG_036790 [Trichomonas vaginalis G3]|uniref:Tetraspanin family protein n=1 Tax=Trichomonas vaginalis (strain ATCC PRA-98 / G3) TaxID=412133 RepID=A2FXK0_TRIV3|nr:hypothetical protein TVAGG3_0708100 [Trichomonas vaginalis G3]EAX90367.1 hypothetical protein TVAG_036790 [Trichomonas vaginalis G3]KAI5509699.1 hypothetical protein TVAGG3_0708100 [Trichomonas vaginalis G3]|eukprot:XP_001303297.1 hypothetical protein [Trichomonas vaginalis G3]
MGCCATILRVFIGFTALISAVVFAAGVAMLFQKNASNDAESKPKYKFDTHQLWYREYTNSVAILVVLIIFLVFFILTFISAVSVCCVKARYTRIMVFIESLIALVPCIIVFIVCTSKREMILVKNAEQKFKDSLSVVKNVGSSVLELVFGERNETQKRIVEATINLSNVFDCCYWKEQTVETEGFCTYMAGKFLLNLKPRTFRNSCYKRLMAGGDAGYLYDPWFKYPTFIFGIVGLILIILIILCSISFCIPQSSFSGNDKSSSSSSSFSLSS